MMKEASIKLRKNSRAVKTCTYMPKGAININNSHHSTPIVIKIQYKTPVRISAKYSKIPSLAHCITTLFDLTNSPSKSSV